MKVRPLSADHREFISIRRIIAVCALGIISGCGGGDGGEERTTLAIVDSAVAPSWDATEDSGLVYSVEVSSAAGIDTVRDVIAPFPVVVGDTLVVGLIQVSEDSSAPQRKLFRLRPGRDPLERQPLPPDVWAFLRDFVISPEGRYVAYVAEDPLPGNLGTFAVVRDIVTGDIIARGPAGGGCDCDVDSNYARWIPPDSFEIAVSHAATGAGWQLVSGRASNRRVHVDTLAREPEWE
ncbi:MAG TPA: hypothetical protein VFS56_05740 [Gemmatimonadaceae bacterium]|nr:hypothetical protein [Gemmatimonadaceae bacterium]